ncbi:hypothetical protein KQI76_08600 [Amphibacillus sp. MSJ-3]|uniref:hypothetical protein n=1 Tax=Amphibacillus sp. MSJ-3 TaxID=2841505 RepID=UPI001C0EC499|nr:hypothetical protein [Amphibacillus sp. MSJ-3]MBU5595222.1 hypothetical protein [Amphibacillus sp. MSJ-3]
MQDHIYDLCKQHMNKHVLLQTTSGEQINGIIMNFDDENVYLAVPARSNDLQVENRQYNPYGGGPMYPPSPHPQYGGGPPYPPGPGPRPPYGPGTSYPPYGPGPYYPGYPSPTPPYGPGGHPGSYSQLVIPLAALAALTVLPLL